MPDLTFPAQRRRVEHVPTDVELYAASMAKKVEQERSEANDAARALLRQHSQRSYGGAQ